MPAPANAPTAVPRLVIAWSTTLAALLAATWPLWTPLRDAPRIALFGVLPAPLEFVLLVAIAGGLLTARLRGNRRAISVTTVALLVLMISDQLRWQPWAYHAVLVGMILATSTAHRIFAVLRVVTIAVYGFSAVAKLDAEFMATLGRQMVGVLLAPVGVNVAALNDTVANALALSLPLGELGLSALLVIAWRWNRFAKPVCVLVALMHATTIAVLSPWGLDHSLGVLLWNVGFAWQTILLFGSPTPDADTNRQASPLASAAAVAVLLLGVIAPLGTPLGLWDQWPGWALYAPGCERATLVVRNAAIERLPESMQAFVDSEEGSSWQRLRLDEWVLGSTGAPIYPQNRVSAAMAVGLIEHGVAEDQIRVVVESAADRRTRERTSETLRLRYQMEAASQFLGTVPSVVWSR